LPPVIAALCLLAALSTAPLVADAPPVPLPRTVPLFSSNDAAPVVLPAVFDDRVLLKAEIDGHPVWLHLDTGSSSLALGARDAAIMGIKSDLVTHYTQPVSVTIGTVNAPGARFEVLPHYGFGSHDRHVSGLIGGAFFHANVVTIDYPHQRATFYPPGTYVPPPGVTPTPIELAGNVPVVTATIGTQQGQFLMDTGSPISELSASFAKKIHPGIFRGNTTTVGIDGERSEPIFDSPDILFGNVNITHSQFAVADPPRVRQDGILGRNLLSFFSITLDYAHYQAYFVPGPSAIPK
jgi:hypothetical protein